MSVAELNAIPATAWLRDSKAESPGLSIEKMPQLTASFERFSENIGIALARHRRAGVSGHDREDRDHDHVRPARRQTRAIRRPCCAAPRWMRAR